MDTNPDGQARSVELSKLQLSAAQEFKAVQGSQTASHRMGFVLKDVKLILSSKSIVDAAKLEFSENFWRGFSACSVPAKVTCVLGEVL